MKKSLSVLFLIVTLGHAVIAESRAPRSAPLAVPAISSLSAASLSQAGRLRISGTGFGAAQNGGVIKIGGVSALVSRWSDNAITAYLPDSTPLGTDAVQVVNSAGMSNIVQMQVTARPAATGHVLWRFKADSYTIRSRPAVGADGTVYAADTDGHLYALTPGGGLKWIFNSGPGDLEQPVSVGSDGTIYIANLQTVFAVHPDGSLKWSRNTGALIFAGPTAGPDGNVYGADDDFGNSSGLGAFVLSGATGAIIANKPGFSVRLGYNGFEVVFGPPNQWYFATNAAGAVTPAGSLFAFTLGTANQLWAQPAEGQPRLQPSGNIVLLDGNRIHYGLVDYSSSSALVWRSMGELAGTVYPGVDAQSQVDVGPDGNVYVGALKSGVGWSLTSLNVNGTFRWRFLDADRIPTNPAVNAQNTAVLYAANGTNEPSHVHALTTAGALLWTEILPVEDGGNIQISSTPRFSNDGSAAYAGTVVNAQSDTYCYLYAFAVIDAPLQLLGASSLKTHGSAGVFGVNLPLTGTPGVESRNGGSNGDHTIAFTFNTTLASGEASVTVGPGSVSGAPVISGNVLTVNLTGIGNGRTATVTLHNVRSAANELLPDTAVSASFLLGDITNSGTVTAADVGQAKTQSGAAVDNTTARIDVNLSGVVNVSDISLIKSQSGARLQ